MAQNFTELFTHATQELINRAAALAQQLGNPTLLPLHVLAATLEHEFSRSLFYSLGIPLEHLQAIIEQELTQLPSVSGGQLIFSSGAFSVFH